MNNVELCNENDKTVINCFSIKYFAGLLEIICKKLSINPGFGKSSMSLNSKKCVSAASRARFLATLMGKVKLLTTLNDGFKVSDSIEVASEHKKSSSMSSNLFVTE